MKLHSPRGAAGRLLLAIVAATLVAGPARAGQPTGLKAFFRSGQTFITWKESGAARYRLYRSAGKIAEVKAAKLIAVVAKGSSRYPLESQYKGPYVVHGPDGAAARTYNLNLGYEVLAGIAGKSGYGSRYIIEDNPGADPAKMLPADTGLFVYTPHEAGTFYYAVTAVGADGEEDRSLSDANRLAGGVAEKREPLGAVLVYKAAVKDGSGKVVGDQRVYCHWMDAAEWNPGPTGGYAFNFGVGVPSTKPRGLIMFLHGYSGYYGTRGPTGDVVSVVPGDPYQTWFYGHRDVSGKKVVNYTERRMLATVDFVVRQLRREGLEVDANKVYLLGASMGGTGGNFLGARYGDVFVAAIASLGAVDHNRNGNWTGSAERLLWGARSEALPANEAANVWDHQNLIKWHLANMGKETAFMLDGHASNDGSVPFTAVPDYYEALQKAKRPFAAVWGTWGHSGMHEPRWPNHRWWGMFQFNLNESLPAIGWATSNDDPRKQPSGQINEKVEWCSRENDFDKGSTGDNLVDEPGRWACCIRSLTGRQTASITPRRCQKFKPKPGQTFRWENHGYADPAQPSKVADGTVTADRHGLVTVEKFQFDKPGWGNRLVIYAEK